MMNRRLRCAIESAGIHLICITVNYNHKENPDHIGLERTIVLYPLVSSSLQPQIVSCTKSHALGIIPFLPLTREKPDCEVVQKDIDRRSWLLVSYLI